MAGLTGGQLWAGQRNWLMNYEYWTIVNMGPAVGSGSVWIYLDTVAFALSVCQRVCVCVCVCVTVSVYMCAHVRVCVYV